MRNRAVGIILNNGKLLLLRRVKPDEEYFVLPGGGIEEGETPEQALLRELHDELGIEPSTHEKVFTRHTDNGEEHYFLITAHAGTPNLGPEIRARMTEENQYFIHWVDVMRLPASFQPREIQERIRALKM
ncbi:MAG: NUDIX domain-containing protein [Patescibacteria group bacterium]|jgi:mutator protein MutT